MEQGLSAPSLLRDLAGVKPNPGHYALAELERMGILKWIITQNIDDLHRKAGNKNVLEYHGNASRLRCTDCNARFDSEEYDLERLKEEGKLPPLCQKCGGRIKSDVAHEVFGENLMVYQLSYYVAFKKLGIKGKILVEDLARRVEMFLMGRAAYKLKALYPKYPPEAFFGQSCVPSFLRNWHNHFDNYGNYLPGYCGGISLGDCQNLDELFEEGVDLDQHPVLRFLIEQDFKGVFRFAQDFGYRALSEGYISKCHLCVDIRKHLLGRREFEELRPKEFYSHLD